MICLDNADFLRPFLFALSCRLKPRSHRPVEARENDGADKLDGVAPAEVPLGAAEEADAGEERRMEGAEKADRRRRVGIVKG